jgi:hypothetical protein
MIKLIHQDGYGIGEIEYLTGDGGTVYSIDASKDGQRWQAVKPTRYEAAVDLMVQLGWDLMDG